MGQRQVGQDFRGAAEDRRSAVHARIARHHSHVFRTKISAEREELFVDQGLDRAGVDRTITGTERFEMERGSDQRFS